MILKLITIGIIMFIVIKIFLKLKLPSKIKEKYLYLDNLVRISHDNRIELQRAIKMQKKLLELDDER